MSLIRLTVTENTLSPYFVKACNSKDNFVLNNVILGCGNDRKQFVHACFSEYTNRQVNDLVEPSQIAASCFCISYLNLTYLIWLAF